MGDELFDNITAIIVGAILGVCVLIGLVILFLLIFFSKYTVESKKIKKAFVLKRSKGTCFIATFDGVGNVDENLIFNTKEEAYNFLLEQEKNSEENQ